MSIIHFCIIYFTYAIVSGVQFLNITFLLALFTGAAAAAVFGTVINALTCIYASLKLHKIDLIIEVLDLMSPLKLYVPRDSSFISTQFPVLNLHR